MLWLAALFRPGSLRMLPPPHRLRRSADIQELRQKGRRYYHPLLLLFAQPNQQAHSRFAVAAGRRIGKAVKRNRAKRLAREAIRLQLPHIKAGWDCLLVWRQNPPSLTLVEVHLAIESLMRSADLFHSPADSN